MFSRVSYLYSHFIEFDGKHFFDCFGLPCKNTQNITNVIWKIKALLL